MTILATKAALQALHLTISGVRSAPTVMPLSLNTADLPCVLVFAGESTWNELGNQVEEQQREYICKVFVNTVVDGNPDAVIPFLALFGLIYYNNITLSGTVNYIERIRDSGQVVLEWAGVQYHGTEFRLRASERAA